MTKNELKKLAKMATSITSAEGYTDYDGTHTVAETSVSYDEMIERLSHCSRWAAEVYGSEILVSATDECFTVTLPLAVKDIQAALKMHEMIQRAR